MLCFGTGVVDGVMEKNTSEFYIKSEAQQLKHEHVWVFQEDNYKVQFHTVIKF